MKVTHEEIAEKSQSSTRKKIVLKKNKLKVSFLKSISQVISWHQYSVIEEVGSSYLFIKNIVHTF